MINEQILNTVGVTLKEYKKWCKDNHKYFSLTATKREFFEKIMNGSIIRNADGELVNVKRKKKNDGR